MEALPKLPMISFDLKVSPEHPSGRSKLKQYIREFYNEDPESYATEIRALETLRATAVHPVKDVSGCAALKKYFCQLHFLQSRFPMGKDGKAAITFTWKDTYVGLVASSDDIKVEMAAILYNIGALHSQLGSKDNRNTPEGLKMACTHFQCAAWSFQHLKDTYPQPPGFDLSPELMHFKHHVCLAQAHECILEKSMTDNRKASINAKISSQITDYYNLSLSTLLQAPSDESSILDIVGSKNFKNWKKYIKFKIAYYSCICMFYQGMQAEENQKMGERVAYYQGAVDRLNEAIMLSKGVEQIDAVMETLVFTRDIVEAKRKVAKNENEFIYYEEIPDLDNLPAIKGASLVKGIPFSVNDVEISGPDIFARLVPMKAHEASSLYSEEKAKLLRRIGTMIDSKDVEIVNFMSCLHLEYLRAHLDSIALPEEVVDRCAALTAMPDAIPNLVSAMNKLNESYNGVDGMLKEIMELIKIEETSEAGYQALMGPRPPSIVATDLTREANKYMEAHKKAAESNETLHKAMTQHIENLKVLQKPLSEIQAGLPNLSSLNLNEDQSLKEVCLLADKVSEMRKQRAMLASQLRESICSDDITGQLVTRSDEKIEDIFSKELEKHNKYVTLLEQNLAAQENIIRAFTNAYANYAPTRKATTEVMRQRDLMLSALISSYDAYEDLLAKSSKGQEFYRKLETNLTKLLQKVKGTCKVQQEEREAILEKNVKKHEEVTPTAPKLKHYLQAKIEAVPPYAQLSQTPGVRPTPLGSERNELPQLTDSQPYYSPTHVNHAEAAKGYANPQAYYHQSLYSQNPALKSLQYPSIDQSSSIYDGYQSDYMAYYSQNTSSVANSQVYPYYNEYYQDPQNYNYQQPSQTASPQHQSNAQAPPNPYQQPSAQSSLPPYYQLPSDQPSPTLKNNTQTPQSSGQSQTPQNPYQQPSVQSQALQNTYQQPSAQSSLPPYYQLPSDQPSPTLKNNNQTPQSSGKSSQTPQSTYQQPSSQSTQPPPYQPSGQPQTPQSTYQQASSQSTQPPPYQPSGQPQTPQSTYQQASSQSTQPPSYEQCVQPSQMPQSTYQQPSIQSSLPPYYQLQSDQPSPAAKTTSQTPQSAYQQPSGQSFQTPQTYQPSLYQQPSQTQSAYQQPNAQSAPPSYYQLSSGQPSPTSKAYQQPGVTSSQYAYQQPSQPVQNASQQAASEQESQYAPGYQNYSGYQAPGYQFYGQNDPNYANYQNYYQQYYAYQDYSNTYPNIQNQSTPGTDTSHYSHAGAKLELNSTQSPPNFPSAIDGLEAQNYYTTPYGHQDSSSSLQYQSPRGPDEAIARPNAVTYMQSSTANVTMTNSKQPSNVDLLAGLDFDISDAPLEPKIESVLNQDLSKLNINEKPTDSTKVTKSQNLETETKTELERPSPSKTPLKDPLSDQEALDQFVQEVEKFEKFVEGLNSKTLNGPTPLDLKWNELQDLQDKDAHKLSISVARCYPMKNRFADILPYDNSRVELPSTKDDYINASYLKDIGQCSPNFIMTQAPLPVTYSDFWSMVVEQHVELIICLLSEAQLNGDVYWPSTKVEDLTIGKLKISLQSNNVKPYWVEKIFLISDGKSSHVVMHLEFTSWPSSWLPESPGPLLSLVNETFAVWSQQRGTGPVIVHCQSGVGRSGVFVLMSLCIADLKLPPIQLPDILLLTSKISKLRKNPLRDRQHLLFSYQCLLYYAQDILMKRGILASKSSFDEKRTKTKSHTRHPSEDFLLSSFKEHEERRQSDASSTGSIKPSEGDPLSQIDPLWPIKRYS